MTSSRSVAQPLDNTAISRRGVLLLMAAGVAWTYSARLALGQTEVDENGRPIRLPGETPTPETKAKERGAVQQQRDRAIQDRAQQRSIQGQQQFQNDRAAAQQRESTVQQNFDAQRNDILNNRDKP